MLLQGRMPFMTLQRLQCCLTRSKTCCKYVLVLDIPAWSCVACVQAQAVTAQEKTLIILNPQLKDVPSSDGIMGVRRVHVSTPMRS